MPLQIGNAVMRGGRPEVPPFEALPGPDTVTFAGLDIYCEVMRCVLAVILLSGCTHGPCSASPIFALQGVLGTRSCDPSTFRCNHTTAACPA